MNKSERIAREWLIKEKGYKKEDIFFQSNDTPDFVCTDGKGYEVKRLYGTSVLIYEKQTQNLAGTTIIVVNTEKEEVVTTFEWDNRDNVYMPEISIVRETYPTNHVGPGMKLYVPQPILTEAGFASGDEVIFDVEEHNGKTVIVVRKKG